MHVNFFLFIVSNTLV